MKDRHRPHHAHHGPDEAEPTGPTEAVAPPEAPPEAAPPDVELVVPASEYRAMESRALAAEAKLREVAEGFRAAQQDLESARARLERDQTLRVREALARAFGGVLAALDHLDLAMEHADDGPLKAGLALSLRQMHDALAAEGLERVPTVGRPFDPSIAEAVAIAETADPAQNNVVVEEYRPAYALGGQVVRAAQVRVAKLA
ncbi:MAG: nucleotide exchange factor GrpE [Acidobacteria bacterium]|jgi:molecular chaperone GrpE|nr:nucleotide exchange factor GrpE [Acidobacteriota bacterium]